MKKEIEFEDSLRPGEALDHYKVTLWYKILGLLETREMIFGKFNNTGLESNMQFDLVMYEDLKDRI